MTESKNFDAEEINDSLENIFVKIKKYFDFNKKLSFDKLNDFLESVDLSYIFADDDGEFKSILFSKIFNGATEIDYETCRKGMMLELFPNEGIHKSDEILEEIPKIIYGTPHKNMDELMTIMNMKKLNDEKIPHFNTPSVINEIENKSNLNQKKSHHERRITKMFTEIDIKKLQQLRKAFSLLDLRNKEYIYISELQEVIRKYKFIKLNQEELINFLSLISDDLIQNKSSSNLQKLSINFELYSRAMSTIEQQLLHVNSDTFIENHHDSYESYSYSDMIEDLNNIELENIDYIMVLADISKSIEQQIFESIVRNYEKLINKKSNESDIIYNKIQEGIIYFKTKVKDMGIFLKEMNESSVKKQNKLENLKTSVNRLEMNYKNSEEDYKNLYLKYKSDSAVEITDETERLLGENNYLNDLILNQEYKIEELQNEIYQRGEQLFNLQSKLDKSTTNEKDQINKYNILQRDYETLNTKYQSYLNDAYEKILKENTEQSSSVNIKSNDSKFNQDELNERATIIKLKNKIIFNEENKKIFDMNYEQLILYTLNIETMNKQLEAKNSDINKRIRELESEKNEFTKEISENSKSLYLMKSENARLQNKLSELQDENERNKSFRPSNVLGNHFRPSNINGNSFRASNIMGNQLSKLDSDKISRISSYKGNIGIHNPNRFEKIEKLFDKKEDHIEKKEEIANENNQELRNSEINKIDKISEPTKKIEKNKLGINNDDRSIFDSISITSSDVFFPQNFEADNRHDENKLDITNNNPSIFESMSNTNNCLQKKQTISVSDKCLFDSNQDEIIDNENIEFGENYQISQSENTINSDSISLKEQNKTEHIKNLNEVKTINVDVLEENPFSTKEDNREDSVNLGKIAQHSPFDIDLDLDKRNELKIKQLENDSLTNSIKNTKLYQNKRKITSKIAEEILEEDANGEIVGVSSRESEISIRPSQNRKSSSTVGSAGTGQDDTKSNKVSSHTRRDTIEDIGMIFNKDSQYMCYDFLTLRKTEAIIKMFEDNNEDVSSYEMFSDNIYLIEENNKKSKKYLFITSKLIN